MDHPEKTEGWKIVKPSAKQISDGIARLEAYVPYWKQTPAFLIIKPRFALIVSVEDCVHDDMGFSVQMSIKEKLSAPPDFHFNQYMVKCVWNQPYMSFHKSVIIAPYSFTLYFGSEGVSCVREVHQLMSGSLGKTIELSAGLFDQCFHDDRAEYVAQVKAIWEKPGDERRE